MNTIFKDLNEFLPIDSIRNKFCTSIDVKLPTEGCNFYGEIIKGPFIVRT